MNASFITTHGRWIGASALILLHASCAGPEHVVVHHRSYQKTPEFPSSTFWHAVSKSTPWTAKSAFYGNWGGAGNHGGKPVDLMDEGFRRHDIVYYESRHRDHLRAADRALVRWLESIDEGSIDEAGREFRKRAIAFMDSPVSAVVGKSPLMAFRGKEREGCYFSSPEEINRFFDPSQPGFPEPAIEVQVDATRLKVWSAWRGRKRSADGLRSNPLLTDFFVSEAGKKFLNTLPPQWLFRGSEVHP